MVHTTLWHGTLAGGMAVDDDDDSEDSNEYDSHLDMEMRTRMILIVLCPLFLGPCAWGHPPALERALGKNLGRASHKVLCIFHLSSNATNSAKRSFQLSGGVAPLLRLSHPHKGLKLDQCCRASSSKIFSAQSQGMTWS